MDSRSDEALVLLARQEAERLGHEYIGTEHILLALTQSHEAGGDLLTRLALDAPTLRTRVESIVQRGTATRTRPATLPLTQRTETALRLAHQFAADRGDPAVTPAHVLVGLLREQRNIAALVLNAAGLTEAATVAALWPEARSLA